MGLEKFIDLFKGIYLVKRSFRFLILSLLFFLL